MSDQKKLLTVTLAIDHAHDYCKVRRWLKSMLRGYGIRCVGLGNGDDNAPLQPTAPKTDLVDNDTDSIEIEATL